METIEVFNRLCAAAKIELDLDSDKQVGISKAHISKMALEVERILAEKLALAFENAAKYLQKNADGQKAILGILNLELTK